MGAHTYAEWVNLWLTNGLCGVSNDVGSRSDFLVQSNVDGSVYESEVWDDRAGVTVRPSDDGDKVVRVRHGGKGPQKPHVRYGLLDGSGLLARHPPCVPILCDGLADWRDWWDGPLRKGQTTKRTSPRACPEQTGEGRREPLPPSLHFAYDGT